MQIGTIKIAMAESVVRVATGVTIVRATEMAVSTGKVNINSKAVPLYFIKPVLICM